MLPRIHDARAWTAKSIDARAAWYYPLTDACKAAFEAFRRHPPTFMLPEKARIACAESLQPVRRALEQGRGFAIIEAPNLSAPDATLLYWIVGQGLGRPFAQNVQGTMLYDVRDTGASLAEGARFSVTSYESSFHTDNSFGADVLDYVGLLCLQVAKSGGRSQVLSGYAVHNQLAAEPDLLATLYRAFHVEHRGGEGKAVQVPIFQASGDELLVRYLRYWIEAGHAKVGEPLTAAQVRALDALDACLNRPDLRVEFDLKPGDMYFINNRWTLHNRTAFEDHAEPERRRHLARLWLQKP
jgi:alpha-ketoglutarate-dependent taurine dioxygenase